MRAPETVYALDRFPSCSTEVNSTQARRRVPPENMFIYSFLFFPERGLSNDSILSNRHFHTTFSFSARRERQSYVEAIVRALGTGCRRMFGLSSFFFLGSSSHSHLTGRDDLQRSQGNLEVGSVALEIEQSLSNVLLKLGGVLPRGAVGGDLVDGAHLGCGCSTVGWMS